jgi:membrane protein
VSSVLLPTTAGHSFSVRQPSIWKSVSRWPLRSLWDFQSIPLLTIARRTWKSILIDRLFGRAAELGFYFLFALFPTLFFASSILGLGARSAAQF